MKSKKKPTARERAVKDAIDELKRAVERLDRTAPALAAPFVTILTRLQQSRIVRVAVRQVPAKEFKLKVRIRKSTEPYIPTGHWPGGAS
jgi:hypothetical protein